MRLKIIISVLILLGSNISGVAAVSPTEEMTATEKNSTIQTATNETLQITGSVSNPSPPGQTAVDHTMQLSSDTPIKNDINIIFTEEYETADLEVQSATGTDGEVDVIITQNKSTGSQIVVQPVTNITEVSMDITVTHPNISSVTEYPINISQPSVAPEKSYQIDSFLVRPVGDDARSGLSSEFNRVDGSGFVYKGATVFQGERDIQFRGDLTAPVVGVKGKQQGVLFEPPVPESASPGIYSINGKNDSASIRVKEPKVTTLRVENSHGADISGGTVYPDETGTLPIIAQSNFETAEYLELTVLNENGLDVTGEVIQTDRVRAETATGRPAVRQSVKPQDRVNQPSTAGSRTKSLRLISESGSDDHPYQLDSHDNQKSSYTRVVSSIYDHTDAGVDDISSVATDQGTREQLASGVTAERSVAKTDIEPGESTRITINATAGTNDKIIIQESFSPNVEDTTVERITVNGEQVISPFFLLANEKELFVTLVDIPVNADISIEYTLSTPELDETYRIDGTVEASTRVVSLDDVQVVTGDGGKNSEVTSNGKVRWNVDLSELEGNSFSVTVTGSDDFTTDASRASTEIGVSYDTPSISLSTTRPSRGQSVNINIRDGVRGAVYAVNIDTDDLRDSLSGKEYYNVFRNVGTTQQIGVVTQSGEVFTGGTPIKGTPDSLFAQVRVDEDNAEATTRIRTQSLKSTALITLAEQEASISQANDDSKVISEEELDVVDSGVELTTPRSIVTGSEMSVSGTVTSGVDTVVMYAETNDQFERVDLDSKQDGAISDISVDGTDFDEERRLTVGDAPGNDILSFPGRHRVAVLSKSSILSDHKQVPTVLSRPELMTKPASIHPVRVRQANISLNPIDTDGQAATTADTLNLSGEIRGRETGVIIAVGQRGSVESAIVETTNFSVEFPAETFSQGIIDVFAVSPGRDMQFGDGNIPRRESANDINSESAALQAYIQLITDERDYTKQQITSVIYNETSRDTASDDPIVVRELQLSDPTISIDVPAANQNIPEGERLIVNGTTNVGPDNGLIDISLNGQNESVRAGSIVSRGETTWNGSIRTKGLSPGAYTISVEIQEQTSRREIVITQ